MKRAGIAKLYGLAGDQNSTGDDQKMLDVMSNDIMINALRNSGVCSVLVSEEDEDPIIVPKEQQGKVSGAASLVASLLGTALLRLELATSL